MKGKLLLTDIQSPVEGMQVVVDDTVWFWDDFKIYENNRRVILTDRNYQNQKTRGVNLSELKQIVVEHTQGCYYDKLYYTPLHPSDWKWAIEHIGGEVEFEQQMACDQCLDDPSATDCHCHWEKYKFVTLAKLTHPTPVMYTEEEKKRLEFYDTLQSIHIHRDTIEFNYGTLLCSMCRDGINLLVQKEDIPRLKAWWNEHKKK